nr:MAG TPA: homing endonuclease [Caudoviricetes sp.]
MYSEQEEFVPIPMYPEYLISRNGTIKNAANNNILKPILSNRYYCVTLTDRNNNNKKTNPRIHHLVLATFRPEDYRKIKETNITYEMSTNPHRYVTNHINGDRSDNRLENLEVITQRENVRHAVEMGLRPKDDVRWRKIYLKNLFTGAEHCFRNFSDCADFFNLNRNCILDRYQRGQVNGYLWPKGYQPKMEGDDYTEILNSININNFSYGLKVTNLITGITAYLSSERELGEYLGMNKMYLRYYRKRCGGKYWVIPEMYLINILDGSKNVEIDLDSGIRELALFGVKFFVLIESKFVYVSKNKDKLLALSKRRGLDIILYRDYIRTAHYHDFGKTNKVFLD